MSRVTLAHGAGGKAMRDLIGGMVLGHFGNPLLRPLEDQARIAMHELAAHGESLAEGVGVSFVPGNLQGVAVDFAFQVDDDTALPFVYELLKHEGVSVGPSSGINIAGAVAMARELGPGHTIVTILCDAGSRYLDQLYNAEFLWSRKLPVPDWIVA